MGTTKRCCGCQTEKPLDCFYHNAAKADGHGNRCKECAADYMRLYHHRRKAGTVARIAPKPNLVDERAYLEFFGPRWRQKAGNLRLYGLTLYDYIALWLLQNGRCGICGAHSDARPEQDKRKLLCVDHCHDTGRVRGLLCHRCNLLVSEVERDIVWIEAALSYLRAGDDQVK